MTRCSWAACTAPAKHNDGTFDHCAEHYEDHLAFEEEDRIRAEVKVDRSPLPPKARSSMRLRDVQTCVALGMDTAEIAQHLGLEASYVRALRREAGVPAPKRQAECGTRSGYQRHQRNREPVCDACETVQRDYDREYKRARRAA